MYECPNCSGNLKFNIEYQQMHCEHCGSRYDVTEVDQAKGAAEQDSFDVTVFTCSQCGGEIYSTDHTVAGFCSFCGSTAILESRIQKELRPDYIVPFRQTKEACKTAYMKMMKWALFAPKELKQQEYIESFRGIYMPYWVYDVKQQNKVALHGMTSKRVINYIYNDYYIVEADLDVQYNGVARDGSSSFSDDISEKIAPFDTKRMKEFSPAYLSGFYADTADIEASVYADDVAMDAVRRTRGMICEHPAVKKYTMTDSPERLLTQFGTRVGNVRRVMLPVWFMSYRNQDRVAYAVVNGQTGKVSADIPVDLKKYLLGVGVVTIPIFILLNLLFTFTPDVLLIMVALIAACVTLIYSAELKEIIKSENYYEDEGAWIALQRKHRNKGAEAQQAERKKGLDFGNSDGLEWEINSGTKHYAGRIRQSRQQVGRGKWKDWLLSRGFSIGVTLVMLIIILISFIGEYIPLDYTGKEFITLLCSVITTVVVLFTHFNCWLRARTLLEKDKKSKTVYCLVASLLIMMIAILHPVSDIYYYIGAIVALVVTFITLWDLIRKYNVLATRKLPQFDYRGGDDRA